jgi:hypothetical protein
MADTYIDLFDHNSSTFKRIKLVDAGDGTFRFATDTVVDVGDIEIGAVEIKDAVADKRAPVDNTYGLGVDVTRSALPTGAATQATLAAILALLPTALGGSGGLKVEQTRTVCASADVHAPAANAAAVVTYGADATKCHVVTGIAWSYVGGIPVGGNLLITDDGVTVFSLDIDQSGPGSIEFARPKKQAAANKALVITLAAGGAGVTGKLSITGHFTEA